MEQARGVWYSGIVCTSLDLRHFVWHSCSITKVVAKAIISASSNRALPSHEEEHWRKFREKRIAVSTHGLSNQSKSELIKIFRPTRLDRMITFIAVRAVDNITCNEIQRGTMIFVRRPLQLSWTQIHAGALHSEDTRPLFPIISGLVVLRSPRQLVPISEIYLRLINDSNQSKVDLPSTQHPTPNVFTWPLPISSPRVPDVPGTWRKALIHPLASCRSCLCTR